MLGRKDYETNYVNACEARVQAQLTVFNTLVAKTSAKTTGAFARLFFMNMVLVLETSFMHRLRGLEGKDGNALNEVRMLAASILENDGVLQADSTINYRAETSVLGIAIGDAIVIDLEGFERLASAYFAGIRVRYRA